MTRTGKIARLPLAIRNELGNRLTDGEPGTSLVTWLNSLPEVQAIMAQLFNGRPITEQNLSEWRKEGGGYDDWLRHQEALDWTLNMHERAAELAQASAISKSTLSDDVNTLLLVALARQLQYLTSKPVESAEDRRDLIAISRELSRLRRVDQRAAMVRLQQDKRADELRREQELKDANAENHRQYLADREADRLPLRERMLNEMLRPLGPDDRNAVRKLLGYPLQLVPATVEVPATAATSTQASPSESNQIKPVFHSQTTSH